MQLVMTISRRPLRLFSTISSGLGCHNAVSTHGLSDIVIDRLRERLVLKAMPLAYSWVTS